MDFIKKIVYKKRVSSPFLLLLSVICSVQTNAATLTASESLIKAIDEGMIYKIDVPNPNCPSLIKLAISRPEVTFEKDKTENIDVNIRGYEKIGDRIKFGSFTHENNNFIFKPSTKHNESKNLKRTCDFPSGVSCSSNYQTTEKDYILFEGFTKTASIFTIGSVDYSLKFDAITNKINYTLKSTGIDNVACNYSAAPELVSEIKEYMQEQDAETDGRPLQIIHNSNRSNHKDRPLRERVRKNKVAPK